MLTGTNLVYTKQFNLRIVHEVIRLYGPLSRADIARRTELTGQTISNLVKELIGLGLVYEAERRKELRGAPSTSLAINPDGAFAIGLDVDRDHLTCILVDLRGQVRQREHIDIATPTPEEALDASVRMVETLIARQGCARDRVKGLGVGVPGPMQQGENGRGYVVNPKLFPGWNRIPFADWLHARLRMPVFLENNATAAAVGERWYGSGQQVDSFFYVFFGSELGGGLLLDGQPYHGVTGNAGEIGYVPASLAPDASADAERGHVGMHFNLLRLYERLRADGVEARVPADLERLLAAGHPPLLAWMDDGAELLAGILLAVEYIVDPAAFVYGGRLPAPVLAGLIERVAERMRARRITEKTRAPQHVAATAGSDAAALGVATLPIYQFFAPAPQVLLKRGKGQAAAGARMRAAG